METQPTVKLFTIKELREIHVPPFQRWIVESNLKDLKISIKKVGLLRSIVICKIKTTDQYQCIDGNHLRTIITDWEEKYEDNDLISCIYTEVETEGDASTIFKMLNTNGKQLNLVDITNLNLYRNTSQVYSDIWYEFLKNPQSTKDIPIIKGFTLSTIIDILVVNKSDYKDGNPTLNKFYQERKELLKYLIENTNNYWDEILGDTRGYYRPNGSAIITFINCYFKHELHIKERFNKGVDWKENFLSIITVIFQKKQTAIRYGLVIGKENAGRIFESHLKLKSKTEKNKLD